MPESILLLFHHLRYPDEQGGQRSREVAEALSARGHAVTAFVPNVDPLTEKKAILGLKGLWKTRRIDASYREVRYWVPSTPRNGVVGRLLYGVVGFFVAFLYVLAHARKYRVVAVTTHPLLIAYACFPALIMSSAKLIVEVRDIPADVGVERSVIMKGGLLYNAYKFLEWFLLSKASVIISYSNQMLRHLSIKDGTAVRVIPIGSRFMDVPEKSSRESYKLSFCFFGTLGKVLDLAPVFLFLVELKRIGVSANLSIFGAGENEGHLRQHVAEMDLPVDFMGVISRSEVPHVCSSYDFAVYPVQGGTAVAASLGNKFFDYLAAQVPILVFGEQSEAGLLVERFNLGFASDQPEELAERVKSLFKNSSDDGHLRSKFSLKEGLVHFDKSKLLDEWCLEVERIYER